MKNLILFLITSILFTSCFEDKDDIVTETNITLSFGHYWDGADITQNGTEPFPFTTANLVRLNISKLKYLISNIELTKLTGEKITLKGYYLIDVFNGNVSYTTIETIPEGDYSNLSFTFGFNNLDNYQNYTALNSVPWNVSEELGGGYHFMQLEGQFLNNSNIPTTYAYHTIRAVNTSVNPLMFQDTFFDVNLGPVTISKKSSFNISMNAAEWFKNPFTWDLNTWNTNLMSNFNAQIKMFENGQDVFSLN